MTNKYPRANAVVAALLVSAMSLATPGCSPESQQPSTSEAVQAAQEFHAAMVALRKAALVVQTSRLAVYGLDAAELAALPSDGFSQWLWAGKRIQAMVDADFAAFRAAMRLANEAQHPAVQGALLGEAVLIPNAKPIICGGLCVGGLIAGVTTYFTMMKGSQSIAGAQNEPCISRFGTSDPDDAKIIANVLGCAPTASAMQSSWDELTSYEQSERCATIVTQLREANDKGKGKGVDETELKSASANAFAAGGETVVNAVVGAGMSVTGGPVGKFVELNGGSELVANLVEVGLSVKEVNYTDLVGKAVEIQGVSKKRVEMKLDPPGTTMTIAEATAILSSGKASAKKSVAAALVSTHALLQVVDDPGLAAESEPNGGVKLQRPAAFVATSATMPDELLAKVTMPSSAMEQLILASEATAPALLTPPAPTSKTATVVWSPQSLASLGVSSSGGSDASSSDTSGGFDVAVGTGACSNAQVYLNKKSYYDDKGKEQPYPAGTCFLDSDTVYQWCATDGLSTCSCQDIGGFDASTGTYLPKLECPATCEEFMLGNAIACDDSQARKDEMSAAKDGSNFYNLQGRCVCSDEFVLAKDEHCAWANKQTMGAPLDAWKTCVKADALLLAKDAFMEQGDAVCHVSALGTSMRSIVQGCGAPPATASIFACLDNDPKTFDVCKASYFCEPGTASAEDNFRSDVCASIPVEAPIGLGCGATVEGKMRCVKVGVHSLPGLPTFDLTAKVRCNSLGSGESKTFAVAIVSAEACELTEDWAF